MDLREWILDDLRNLRVTYRLFLRPSLTAEMWRTEPTGGGNAPAWYLWHAARWQDVAVNVLARSATPVLERDDWHERLNIDHSLTGTGMTQTEASNLAEAVNLEALEAYFEAVLAETANWIEGVDLAALSEARPDAPARVSAGPVVITFANDAAREGMKRWWADRNAAFFLRFTAIGHTYMHFGEMQHLVSRLSAD